MVDRSVELLVTVDEVRWFGRPVVYDSKLIKQQNGAPSVSFIIENEACEDASQRSNITGLVITSEGELHVYNGKFAMQLARCAD